MGDDSRRLARRINERLPLIRLWAGRQFTLRYRRTSLGFFWAIARPLATLLVYGWLFRILLRVAPDDLPYLSFAWAGLVVWSFFSGAVKDAFPSIVAASGVISKVYFPKEVVPLAVVGTVMLDLLVTTLILLVLAVVQGVGLSLTLVALPLVFLVLVLWTVAISVFGAAISVFVGDLLQALPIILQFLFISSPIMYPRNVIPGGFEWVVSVNPIAVLAEATRDVVLRHEWPDLSTLGIHALVAAGLLVGALAYVRKVESRMVDEV